MPVSIDWKEIALRLALTVLGGVVIGFNRGEHGRPAGMRTTLLVSLAASLSMIQANLLMNTIGKAANSFIVLDLMRLPLGVLSGMGFIGAGAILRRGNLVLGLTTAATLWFVTLMGLCFGGGQIGLGLAALGLGWATLWALKYVEAWLRQDVRGTLSLLILEGGPTDDDIRKQIDCDHCRIVSWGISATRTPLKREIQCEIQWRARQDSVLPPSIVADLQANPSVAFLRWQPYSLSPESEHVQTKPEGTPLSLRA